MKEFLIENGFNLEEYPDGFFWVLRKHSECFLQFSADFKDITLYQDGWVDDHLTHEELISAIKQMKAGQVK